MTIFDTEEKNLREQIVFLETENNALKAHIIESERDNNALLDTCMKMQEQRIEDNRIIAALKLEREELKREIEEFKGELGNYCSECIWLHKKTELEKENKLLKREFDMYHGKDDD